MAMSDIPTHFQEGRSAVVGFQHCLWRHREELQANGGSMQPQLAACSCLVYLDSVWDERQ